jgi:transcriptional regulator with XRE-family HTH domain
MGKIRDEVLAELHDPEYRHDYAQSFLDMTLARQIRAIRKQRGLSQADLAEALGTRQSAISMLEDEDYGSMTLSTLKELARAFDVYLDVRFTSFSRLADSVEHTSIDALEVPAFDNDPYFDNYAVAYSSTAASQPSMLHDAPVEPKPAAARPRKNRKSSR